MMLTRTRRARDRLPRGLALLLLLAVTGCTHTVKVEPIKVEPIDITLHIYLKADEKLDSFFEDDAPPPSAPTAPSSAIEPVHAQGVSS